MARVSCPTPRSASTTSATTSASLAPCQAAATMARSSRRLAMRKMPGVSTSTTWARLPSARSAMAMPITRMRVVCTLGDTMLTFEPTRALTRVDLPALGAPTMAAKPARVRCAFMPWSIALAQLLEHQRCRRTLGVALGLTPALRRRQVADRDLDQEDRLVLGAFAPELAIGRQGKATALRPFLELGLGRPRRGMLAAQPVVPQALDDAGGGCEAGVEEDRAQERFQHVGQDCGRRWRRSAKGD